jgi:hypothetical protein
MRDFQSGIVGILGFAGVVITILVNTRLAQAARIQRFNQTRLTIQTALREELQCIRDELVNLEKAFGGKSAQPISFTLEQAIRLPNISERHRHFGNWTSAGRNSGSSRLYLLLNSTKELAADPGKKIARMESENFPKAAELVTHALGETNDAIKLLKVIWQFHAGQFRSFLRAPLACREHRVQFDPLHGPVSQDWDEGAFCEPSPDGASCHRDKAQPPDCSRNAGLVDHDGEARGHSDGCRSPFLGEGP